MRNELNRLLEKRSSVLSQAEGLASAESLSQEELATLESLVQELKNLDSRVAALESQAADKSELPEPSADVARHLDSRRNEIRRVPSHDKFFGAKRMNESSDLALRSWFRVGTANERQGDQALAARSGAISGNLIEFRNGLDTQTYPGGNAIVPISMAKSYLSYLKQTCKWLDFCRVLTTESGEDLSLPINNDAYGTNSLAEGWTAELVPSEVKDPDLQAIDLKAWTVQSGLVQTSWELVQDSGVDLGSLIGEILGQRIGRNLDAAFASGDGNGKPKGLVPNVATENVIDSSASGAIAADDLLTLIGQVDAAYSASPKAGFVMHPSTMVALRKLKASGTGEYMLEPSAQAGQPEKIFGYPIYLSSAIPAIASGNRSIIFGDFDRFIIREARSVQIRKSDDFAFSKRATTWLGYARYDSAVADPHAFAALKIKA